MRPWLPPDACDFDPCPPPEVLEELYRQAARGPPGPPPGDVGNLAALFDPALPHQFRVLAEWSDRELHLQRVVGDALAPIVARLDELKATMVKPAQEWLSIKDAAAVA